MLVQTTVSLNISTASSASVRPVNRNVAFIYKKVPFSRWGNLVKITLAELIFCVAVEQTIAAMYQGFIYSIVFIFSA